MRNIALIGAGRSSIYLIRYLLEHARTEDWTLTVADVSEETARQKISGHPSGKALGFDIRDEVQRAAIVDAADLVISMLPANMHLALAEQCLASRKNLVTASYVSEGMLRLDEQAKATGILFLNECGLDPGIDHMSTMDTLEKIRARGGEMRAFKSFTGGLVAPESNDNPWGYKFSWNPRNVILAGQGTARYIDHGNYHYIPYNRLFAQSESISVTGSGIYDGYANRDSLAYRKIYGLEKIPTLLRGTLRQQGYCRAWNIFVQLGLTDDSYVVEDSEHLSYADLVAAYLPVPAGTLSLRQRVASLVGLDEKDTALELVAWTGIFGPEKIGMARATPAQILQHLLEQKWKLNAGDKDLVIMQHRFIYALSGREYAITSTLVVKGEDEEHTAMARTVGLPVAIAAKNILQGNIRSRGVQLPVTREIYGPILDELARSGIRFTETTEELA